MDDFNFKKHSVHTPRMRSSMDGFVTPDSFKRAGSLGFSESKGNKASDDDQSQKLDDFKRSEGYHSTSQPISGSSDVAMSTTFTPPLLSSAHRNPSKFGRRSRGRRLSTGIKPERTWQSTLKRASKVLGMMLVAGLLYFGIKIYIVEKHIFKGGGSAPALAESVDITKLRGEGDGRINILLLGNGGQEHAEGPDLTDTIMVVSIDPINNQAALLSIPRDFWVQVPGHGSRKINEAYFYGKSSSNSKDESEKQKAGIDLVDKTLSPILGIPIHYHVVVDFAAFRQAVNATGGIDVNIPGELTVNDSLWDESTGKSYALNVPTGQQHFDGQRALLYARTRYTSVRGDFDRAERQRLLLVALKDKVLSIGTFSNPLKISQLLSSLGNNVYSDFGSGDIPRLYKVASQLPSNNIFSLDLVTPPHDLLMTAGLNGLSTVQPKAGLYEYAAIQNYVRNALKDGFIQQENASIMILNGTDKTGIATAKSTELKSYGYNVTEVGDAPTKDYEHTVLVDLRGGAKKFTKNYLEKRLGVFATSNLPSGITSGSADFVIILGSDTVNTSSSSQ